MRLVDVDNVDNINARVTLTISYKQTIIHTLINNVLKVSTYFLKINNIRDAVN